MFKKSLVGALMAAGSLMAVVPAHAQYSAVVRVAPPPPLQEAMPAPRSGYVWAPGHYEWRGDQHVWIRGHWMPERYGYEYREPRWVQRGNGEWYLVGGDWVERDDWPPGRRYGYYERRGHRFGPNGDLDRDGIRNFEDRDRDGDGVRNRRDAYPNDPTRS